MWLSIINQTEFTRYMNNQSSSVLSIKEMISRAAAEIRSSERKNIIEEEIIEAPKYQSRMNDNDNNDDQEEPSMNKAVQISEIEEESKEKASQPLKKVVSIATSDQIKSFIMVDKFNPSVSFILQLDKSDEDELTIAEIEKRVAAKLSCQILIEETYFTDSIDKTTSISYYTDSQPIYFKMLDPIDLQYESLMAEKPGTFKVKIGPKETFRDLYKRIAAVQNISISDFLVFFEFLYKTSKRIGPRFERIDSMISDFKRVKVTVTKKLNPTKITIKTLTGRTFSLACDQDESIEELKIKIQDQEGIPPEQQNLWFGSKYLEDDFCLKDYKIQDDSQIQLVLNLRGGGTGEVFADISNDGGAVKLQWSSTAPRWRVATNGLNLEGQCKNLSCQAYKKSNVIMRKGFTTFDLMFDQDHCKCPMCSKFVEPITCGFSNCEYTFSGLKKIAGQKPIRYSKQAWTGVGDEYLFYDPRESGIVEWISLKIYARPKHYGEPEMACAVCKDPVDKIATSGCGHAYHDECKAEMLNEASKNCYLCHI